MSNRRAPSDALTKPYRGSISGATPVEARLAQWIILIFNAGSRTFARRFIDKLDNVAERYAEMLKKDGYESSRRAVGTVRFRMEYFLSLHRNRAGSRLRRSGRVSLH
jgi:hypothetical protein